MPPARPELTLVRPAAPELEELEFAVIDLETTGWSPGTAAITEIAAVRVSDGRRRGEFASLVNPGVPVPPGIEDLTGISDWMLAAAPKLPGVLPGLLDFADGCVLVAHNAPFDVYHGPSSSVPTGFTCTTVKLRASGIASQSPVA